MEVGAKKILQFNKIFPAGVQLPHLNNTIQTNKKENDSLKVNLENQLIQLTNQKDVERERAVLEVERKYQERLQAIHDQYNEKLANLYDKFESGNRKKQGSIKSEDKK